MLLPFSSEQCFSEQLTQIQLLIQVQVRVLTGVDSCLSVFRCKCVNDWIPSEALYRIWGRKVVTVVSPDNLYRRPFSKPHGSLAYALTKAAQCRYNVATQRYTWASLRRTWALVAAEKMATSKYTIARQRHKGPRWHTPSISVTVAQECAATQMCYACLWARPRKVLCTNTRLG